MSVTPASDIDNQQALKKAFPVVPCKFQIQKVRWRHAMRRCRAMHRMSKPSMMASAGDAFFKPFMATNQARRNLLSESSSQLHMFSFTLCALLKAALFDY
jgi:hypothetical protein